MTITKWKAGTRISADAQKVYEEIREICDDIGSASPQDILEKARDESTELHKCFTWDDSIAAEKYRLWEARSIVTKLVYQEKEVPKDRPEVRVYQKTDDESGYKPVEIILQKQDEYTQLLARAYAELRAFKQKYKMLKELQEILDLID